MREASARARWVSMRAVTQWVVAHPTPSTLPNTRGAMQAADDKCEKVMRYIARLLRSLGKRRCEVVAALRSSCQ